MDSLKSKFLFKYQQIDQKKYVLQYKIPNMLGITSADSFYFTFILNELHFFFKEKKSLYSFQLYSSSYLGEIYVLINLNRDLHPIVENTPNVIKAFGKRYLAEILIYQFSYSNGEATVIF